MNNNKAEELKGYGLSSFGLFRNNFEKDVETAYLKYQLDKAVRLSNLFDDTVVIQYESGDSTLVQEEAKVLTMTKDYVILKGDKTIPIAKIKEVIV